VTSLDPIGCGDVELGGERMRRGEYEMQEGYLEVLLTRDRKVKEIFVFARKK